MKNFIKKYGHCWTILYLVFYMAWFVWLEHRQLDSYTIMHVRLDDYIPFSDVFVIPYLLWFVYTPVTWLFLFFKDKKEFYRFNIYLYLGMSICLFICTIFPNGQDLRVNLVFSDNIFSRVLKFIYTTDTSTNVFPSIHVYNSIAVHVAITNSKHVKKGHWITILSLTIMSLICVSTVFLKQHSILDVTAGVILALVLYFFFYTNYPKQFFERIFKTETTQETTQVN